MSDTLLYVLYEWIAGLVWLLWTPWVFQSVCQAGFVLLLLRFAAEAVAELTGEAREARRERDAAKARRAQRTRAGAAGQGRAAGPAS